MVAVGDEDFVAAVSHTPFKLSGSVLTALEKLCLDRLPWMGGDDCCEPVAHAILEGVGKHDALQDRVAAKRALQALRLLKKIDTMQSKLKGEKPFSAGQTKGVLWRALFFGWEKTKDSEEEKRLADGILSLKCFDSSEWKALRSAFYEIRGDHFGLPDAKVAALLARAKEDSNSEILRLMGAELMQHMRPKHIAQIGASYRRA